MLHKVLMAMMASCCLVAAQTTTEQYPSAAEIAAAQASVIPYSPTSNVPGKVFNRFIDIWLENTVSILCTECQSGIIIRHADQRANVPRTWLPLRLSLI